MDINKALRKQKKSYKRFLLSMGFIFLILPVVLILSGKKSNFFIIYLVLLQGLIIAAVIIRRFGESLQYQCKEDKLDISQGFWKKKISLQYEKVSFVHVEKQGKEILIIILTTSKFRNESFKAIDANFLSKNPLITKEIESLLRWHPENKYYYTTIKEGGFLKYELLDVIYKSCTRATFTEEAIERIKEYRK